MKSQEITGNINYCTYTLLYTHTKHSPSVEASNIEVIYSDDDHYECIAEQPNNKDKEDNTDSMYGNSAYELADQGEGAEATPTRSSEFGVARNDSYGAVEHVENLYEETTQ